MALCQTERTRSMYTSVHRHALTIRMKLNNGTKHPNRLQVSRAQILDQVTQTPEAVEGLSAKAERPECPARD